jgi:uncharacterized protein YecE (DUF72 family)
LHAINVGISGWRYPPWRGTFYPPGLPQKKELEFASRMLPTIELNGSFYSLQRPDSYRQWYEATPRGFVFSVKGPRYITHILRLRSMETALANFLASGILNLREKLGPLLWQFPPNFRFDEPVFAAFLAQLPRDTTAAAALARHHDAKARFVQLEADRNRRLRHAVEIRNESFLDERFIALLRKHRVALVVADTAGKWPYFEDQTADFMYLRLHGDKEIYASGYGSAALARWAERIRLWSAGKEPEDARRISTRSDRQLASRRVFCYFDNDIKVRAPFDAAALMQKLGIDSPLNRGLGAVRRRSRS